MHSLNSVSNNNENVFPVKIVTESYEIKDLNELVNNPVMKLKQWKFNFEDIMNWTEPDKCIPKKRKGCAIDSLQFLKIIPNDVGNYLTKHRTHIREYGTEFNEIIELINTYEMEIENKEILRSHYYVFFNEKNSSAATNIKLLNDFCEKILKESYGTIISIVSYNVNINHTTVLISQNGNIMVFDPQLNMLFKSIEDYILKIIGKNDFLIYFLSFVYLFLVIIIQTSL